MTWLQISLFIILATIEVYATVAVLIHRIRIVSWVIFTISWAAIAYMLPFWHLARLS